MGKQFILDCNASDSGLSKADRRYCVTRRELLAIVLFVKYFRHYLYGVKFLIRTDHGSLRLLFNFKEPGQVARWIETLSTFQFDIQHRPGKQHENVDALSRIPCKQCGRNETVASVAVEVKQGNTRKVEAEPESASWISGWTAEFIREEQMKDLIIGKILRVKETSNDRTEWKDISGEDYASRPTGFGGDSFT